MSENIVFICQFNTSLQVISMENCIFGKININTMHKYCVIETNCIMCKYFRYYNVHYIDCNIIYLFYSSIIYSIMVFIKCMMKLNVESVCIDYYQKLLLFVVYYIFEATILNNHLITYSIE